MSDREVSGAARALRGSASFDQTFLNALGDQKNEVVSRIFKGQTRPAWEVTVRLSAGGMSPGTWFGTLVVIFMHCPSPQEIIDFIKEANKGENMEAPNILAAFDNIRAGRVQLRNIQVKE